jgi:hypothetical protein
MALAPFNATEVLPGQPLTAAAWNEIVRALAAVTENARAGETSAARVRLANTDLDPAQVSVTAVSADGTQGYGAVRTTDSSGGALFLFSGLRPGAYSVRAEAPGFDAANAPLTVPQTSGDLTLTLVRRGAVMPPLFGVDLRTALDALSTAGIQVGRIVDAQGREVAPANPGAEALAVPVLMQLPGPGEPAPPGVAAQLAIAAPIRVEPTIQVPQLTGLTQAEARQALEAAGLTLGKVIVRRRVTP